MGGGVTVSSSERFGLRGGGMGVGQVEMCSHTGLFKQEEDLSMFKMKKDC